MPFATDQFFAGDGSAFSAAKWGTSSAGPFNANFTNGNNANFATVNGTGNGASITVSVITATENFTITTIGGTISNQGNAVIPVSVTSGKTLDFSTQAFTTSATAGYNFTGPGVLATNGNTYGGGFTINSGTLVARGVNAMGGNATPGGLTINGGTIAGSAARDFSGKYSGITVGGDFQLGALATDIPLSSSTANLTFSNDTTLGAATRTITIGGNGTYTLGGIISGNSGTGLTVANVSGATGKITLTGANTYTGNTTINAGTLALSGGGSIANSPTIEIAGGATFDVSGLTTALTLASGQGLKASGSTTTGTIATASGKGLTTASNSSIQFTAFDGTHAPLTISGGGTITLASTNPVTVNTTSALGAEDYTLISKGSATIAGSVPTGLTMGGSGLAAGMGAVLQSTVSGLVLHVAAAGSLQFSSATYSDSETDADHSFNVLVTRSGGSTGAVTVNYSVTDGSATTADSDYAISPASGTLSWADSDTAAKNITITVKGDTKFEPDETVNIAISSPGGGATLGTPNSSVLTITNDDPSDVTLNASGNLAAGTYHDVTINSAAVVTLTGNVTITGTLTINSGGTLVCGTNTVSGGGTFTLSAGGTLSIGDLNGITNAACGTVNTCGNIRTMNRTFATGASFIYTGSDNQAVGNGLPSSVINLTIVNGGSSGHNTVTGNANQVVTGTLEIQSGIYSSHSDYNDVTIASGATLDLSADITVSGNWTNNNGISGSGLNANGYKVTFDGNTNQTIRGTTRTTFAALQISNTGSANSNIVSLSAVDGASSQTCSSLSVTAGVFDQNTGANSVNLTTTGTGTVATVSSGATWQNLGTSDLTLSGDVSNSGTINFNANGTPCGQNDDILIRSSLDGTPRTWSGTGTFSMTDVNVKDQKVPGTPNPPLFILVNSGTNVSGNTGWQFVDQCTSGTYTWIGGTLGAATDWTVGTNWNPTRVTPSTADILIFDGNSTPSPTVTNVPTQTIAVLTLRNNGVAVTLNTSSTNTLTIGGTTGNDLSIPSGTSLSVSGTNALTIALSSGSAANVDNSTSGIRGSVSLLQGAHRLTGASASSIVFKTGSIFSAGSGVTTGFTGNPFGTGTNESVVFDAGSNGFFNEGGDPFGGDGHKVAGFNFNSTAAFNAASALSCSNPVSSEGRSYGNLVLDNQAGGSASYTCAGALPLTVLNNLSINSGRTFTLSSSAGGDLILDGNFSDDGTFAPNSRTVNFNGAATLQTITKSNGTESFDDVSIAETSGGEVKLLSPVTISGQLNLSTASSVLELNAQTLTLNGTVIGSGNFKGDSSATLNMTGTGALGTVNFLSGARTLSSMTMNRTSSGSVIFGNDLSVGSLALTNGIVNMGTFTLSVSGAVSRSSGWIIGNEQRTVTCSSGPGCAMVFDVGTANGYSGVSESLNVSQAGSYTQTAKAVQSRHPSLSGTNALQRYWTLNAPSGPGSATANITFNYLATDVVGTAANYVFFKYNGGVWLQLAPASAPTNTSATINSVGSFSDWTLAEPAALTPGSLQFSAANFNDSETNADHSATITVTRAGGSDGAVSVHWATSAGTATAGTDYVEASGDLNWADGETANKTFTVTVKGDPTYEANETVNLTLSAATGAASIGGTNPATLTIVNDDNPPATLVVNTTADTDDGLCSTDPGGCTLREAINAANFASDANTITFNIPNTDSGCSGGSCTVTLGSTLPSIQTVATAGAVTIDGGGVISISGNNLVRPFVVNSAANLTLQNLTVKNGRISGGNGGAIDNEGGTVNIDRSTFQGNTVVDFGNGGAIWSAASGAVNITSSTFTANGAPSSGAIRNFSGTMNVVNSTFNNNAAGTFAGGGIENSDTLTVTNSTFSTNYAGAGYGGGAIYNSGTATFKNSIFTDSTQGNCSGPNAIIDGGGNLRWPTADTTCPASIPFGDPKLGALANNGGPTQTMALGLGSAAIDTGNNSFITNPPFSGPPFFDQRGVGFLRQVDGNSDGTATVDIGAYEAPACTTPPATPSASNGGPYCEGATIQLSTDTVSGATYAWTGPNGFTSTDQNPTRLSATTADAGTYSVTITVNGCTSAAGTTNVVINATPATPSASNGGPYCDGATIALSTPFVSGGTYAWTGPNGFTSALQNPTRANATTADAGTYSVTITVNGCTSAAGTTNVVINATPATPSASNGGPYCDGATIALSTPFVSGGTYAWTGPNGFTSALQNPMRANATTADAGTYSVTITVNACVSAAGTTDVVVNATPATPTASNGGPYLEGSTIQLFTPDVTGASYSWTGPNGFTSTDQNPTRSNATTADGGTYSVTVTVNGCTSAAGTTDVVVNSCPTSFVVNSTADTDDANEGDGICADAGGKCTLRAAIEEANAIRTDCSGLTISFNIPANDPGHVYYKDDGIAGHVSAANVTQTSVSNDADLPTSGPFKVDPDYAVGNPHSWWRIRPDNSLPDINVGMIIDGYSQGASTLQAAAQNTLDLNQGDDAILRIEIDGSQINGGTGDGFELFANDGSTFKGLVINHFENNDIYIEDGGFDTISGNFIGTDVSGTLVDGTDSEGIFIDTGDGALIGGDNPADRNLISGRGGEGGAGISINTDFTTVEGNYIGTDRTGTVALPNTFGIIVDGGNDNTIGCEVLNGDNLISGNAESGIRINNSFGTFVQGNYIGTDKTGLLPLPNGDGVTVFGGGSNNIGIFGFGNLISGNTGEGVELTNSTSGNFVQSNLIGVAANGTSQLPNGANGVEVYTNSTDNTIGVSPGVQQTVKAQPAVKKSDSRSRGISLADSSTEANVIAFNGEDGVRVTGNGDVSNRISQNSIYSNTGLGINLGADGVTDNDSGDADTGPNNLQNFPVLLSVSSSGGSGTVHFSLDADDSAGPFTIEFFSNLTCDQTGQGEGKTYLGSTEVNSSGPDYDSGSLMINPGDVITATATDASGNTSEFSVCKSAAAACPGAFTVADDTDVGDATPGDGVCETVNNTCTLRAAIEEANALTSCGTIDIDFATSGPMLITLGGTQLTIDHNVNINNLTADSVTVNGNGQSRVFTVNTGRTVSISNLTLTGGNGSGGNGGAIQNNGTLSLKGMTLNNNAATNGGAIRSDGALVMTNCTISGNRANGDGGGLYNAINQATLTNVTVAYNRADNDNNASGTGGGVFQISGTVLLHNTIVADNYKGSSPSTTADNVGGTMDSSSSYNLIGTGSGGLTNGTNNNQVGVTTAYLGALINNGGVTATHGLLYNSPAIDAGDDTVLNSPLFVTVDQRALTRPANGDLVAGSHVDIGAYERQATETRDLPNGGNINIDLNDARVTFPCVPAGNCGNDKPNPDSAKKSAKAIGPSLANPSVSITDIDPSTQPAPPSGFVIGNSSSPPMPAFDVSTALVTYDTPVTICFYLPVFTNATYFNGLKVFHNESNVLVNRTSSVDFANKLVCAQVNSFSPFVIGHTATPTATNGTVGGQVVDDHGNPVEGAAMRLSGTESRLTITDAQGNYHFDNVETNGLYVVTPSRANFTFSPSLRSFSQLGAHTEATFTAAASGGGLNPLDTTEYFVRQQYLDFLGREPDESGFNFWVNNIESCGNDVGCREVKRIDTSAAFFLSIEFQQTGYLVYRAYQAAYADLPGAPVPINLSEFRPDTQEISNGVVVLQDGWQQKLEANKLAFMAEFVKRSRFSQAYPTTMTPTEFVDKLFGNASVPLTDSDHGAAIAEFGAAGDSSDNGARARVLRRIAENQTLTRQEFNQAFVLMEYFGYLRRDPNSGQDTDFNGYNFWLDKLNRFNGNFQNAEMVKAFLSSIEYRGRFPR